MIAFSGLALGQVQTYDATAFNGGYAYTISGYANNPNGGNDMVAEAGRLTADGAGNVSGNDTVSINGNAVRRTFTGNYAINADGTGTLTLYPSSGPQIDADIVVGNSGRAIKMVVTDSGSILSGVIEAQGQMSPVVPVPFHNNTASLFIGGYGFTTGGNAFSDHFAKFVPWSEAGRLTSDGAGNITGSSTLSLNGFVVRRTFTGTFTINSDGSGSVSLTPSWGLPVNADVFVSGNGLKIYFVVTDPGNSLAGVMTAQVLPAAASFN